MTVVLECQSLAAGYGGHAVVRGLSLSVAKGQVVALLGPNGAGKTTTLTTLAGFLPAIDGSFRLLGEVVKKANPLAISRAGLVLVPDDRSLFTGMTVEQNLALA